MDDEQVTRKYELTKPPDRPILQISAGQAEQMLWRYCVGVCKSGGLVVFKGNTISWEPRRAS